MTITYTSYNWTGVRRGLLTRKLLLDRLKIPKFFHLKFFPYVSLKRHLALKFERDKLIMEMNWAARELNVLEDKVRENERSI